MLRDERTMFGRSEEECVSLHEGDKRTTIQRGGLGDLIAYVGQGLSPCTCYEIGDGVPKWDSVAIWQIATEFVEASGRQLTDELAARRTENWDGHRVALFDFYGCTDLHHSIFNINHSIYAASRSPAQGRNQYELTLTVTNRQVDESMTANIRYGDDSASQMRGDHQRLSATAHLASATCDCKGIDVVDWDSRRLPSGYAAKALH